MTMPSRDVLNSALHYDPETGILRWRDGLTKRGKPRAKSGREAGGLDASGYRRVAINRVHQWAHRVIWVMMTGEAPYQIDHINGDRSDNRWANLRAATHAQNLHNRGRSRNNATGFKGVYRHTSGRYAAQIGSGRKVTYLGLFDTPEAASVAYANAAASLHGEFARAV